jgi:hypothetical protein
MNPQQYELLRSCLQTRGERFGNYQDLPAFVRDRLPELLADAGYGQRQLELDGPRYRFLGAHLSLRGLSVVEIGANLGYFGLSLTHDHHCRYVGYEPIAAYATAASLLAEEAGVAHLCRFQAASVGLADVPSLPESDLLIELNVLHHGGSVFDRDEVGRCGGWEDYAVERLRRLRAKARYLFFQTGNVAEDSALFPTEQAVAYIGDLLVRANWQPYAVGVIEDLGSLQYARVAPDEPAARTYMCRRNPGTGLVDYFVSGALMGSLATGLANRPLWLCE